MSSLVLSGDTSGTVTLSVPAVSGSNTLTIQAGTGTNSMNTLTTAVASTSGTSINFTDIPAWAKRVTVMFSGVSTNSTSNLLVQVGSGSVTTTGYVTGASQISSPLSTSSTAGFLLTASNAAASTHSGSTIINLLNNNVWVNCGAIWNSAGTANISSGSSPALGGALDRVRITTVNGTDTFDAGSINILYEG